MHVAAKIAALCEMYPRRTKTEIVGDLLSSALDELVKSFPEVRGKYWGDDINTGESVYEDIGPTSKFYRLTNEHFKALEQELGEENPKNFFDHEPLMVGPKMP